MSAKLKSSNCISYIGNGCMKVERKLLIRQCTYELITATIPVFIAAGISSLVGPIIEYIAEEHGNVDAVEIGLSFLYAILAYVIGKCLTFLLKSTEVNSPDSPVIKRLQSEKLLSILYDLFGETSAFAWKEFLVLFIIKLAYLEYGFGPAFGIWIMMVFIFLLVTTISVYTAKLLVKNHEIYHALLEFSEDSFALSIAFTITAISIYGLEGLRVHFARKGGYIDSAGHGGNEGEIVDDDGGLDDNTVLNFLLFASIVTTVVALVIYLDTIMLDTFYPSSSSSPSLTTATNEHNHEETLGTESNEQQQNSSVEDDHEHEKVKEAQHTDEHHTTTWQDDILGVFHKQWRNILGCIVGVCWFAGILDSIVPADTHGQQTYRILALLAVIFLVTWRAPLCTADIVVRKKTLHSKLKKTQERKPADEEVSHFSFSGLWNILEEFYIRVSLERKDAMNTAVRLTLGWTWEIFVITVIEYICEADELTDGENLCIRLVSLCIVIIISYGIHYFIRDWENAAEKKMEEQESSVAEQQLELQQSQRIEEVAMNPMTSQQMER